MKNKVVKKLEGWAVHNPVMHNSVERFFSGSHDTYKEGMPENNKELCEAYIRKNHPQARMYAVPATLYYEIPEDRTFCNKSPKCTESVCFCNDLIKKGLTK